MMGSIQVERNREGTSVSDSTKGELTPESIESLGTDELFDVLSNKRRRWTIAFLNETDADAVRLRDIAEQVAAWENDVPISELTYKERKRVYTSLYQLHLERMDRIGIVRYDPDRGIVEPTPITSQLESLLHSNFGTDHKTTAGRHRISLGASICSVVLVFFAWAGILPISQTGFTLALVIAIVFVVVSSIQAVEDIRR